MIIKCPHCGNRCESDDEHVTSEKLTCPYCGGLFNWRPVACGSGIGIVFMLAAFTMSSILFSLICLLKTCDGMRFALLVASLLVLITRIWKGAAWARGCVGLLGWYDFFLAVCGILYLLCEDHYQIVELIEIFASWLWLIGTALLYIPNVKQKMEAKRYRNLIGLIACPLVMIGILVAAGFPGPPVIIINSVKSILASVVLAVTLSWLALWAMEQGEKFMGSRFGR